MKNFTKLLVITSLSLTALSFAQTPSSITTHFPESNATFSTDSDAAASKTISNEVKSNTPNVWDFFGTAKKAAVSDPEILKKLQENIKNTPHLSDFAKDIQIEVKEAKVTLRGNVGNANESKLIEALANNVNGVQSVSNKLEDKPKLSDEIILKSVVETLRKAPYLTDAAKALQIEAVEGKVTLKGFVATKNESNLVEAIVRNIRGVQSIDNDLDTEKQP